VTIDGQAAMRGRPGREVDQERELKEAIIIEVHSRRVRCAKAVQRRIGTRSAATKSGFGDARHVVAFVDGSVEAVACQSRRD
jgi:hypothetical protein